MKNMTRNRIGFGLMTVLAILIAISAVAPYTSFDPSNFNNATAHYLNAAVFTQLNLYIHIFASGLALIIGPFQFVKRLRERGNRTLHRWMGRVYLLCILLGGLSALVIAPGVISGLTGTFGLSMLAVLWLYTGWMAYRSIRAGHIDSHREWMIRNYALTFAAVTLRLWLGVLIMSQLPALESTYNNNFDALFVEAYRVVMWLSWIPNLLIAEWIVHRPRPSRQIAPAIA